MAEVDLCACAVCGLRIQDYKIFGRIEEKCLPQRFSDRWLGSCLLLSGPHWPRRGEGPRSYKIPDTAVTRHRAEPTDWFHEIKILPNGPNVLLQLEENVDEQSRYEPHASQTWYFGVHIACDELVSRAMQTSQACRIRSTGDLWMTLERRYTKARASTDLFPSFIPKIPENKPGEDIKLGFGRYFLPRRTVTQNEVGRFVRFRDWWEADPIIIPDLTNDLMGNLQPTPPALTSLSQFKKRLASLPQEIKDEIVLHLSGGPVSLDCNYLIPQWLWKQAFLRIPFLWDLDSEIIDQKPRSLDSEELDWDWEKLSRQVLSLPTVPIKEEGSRWETAWDYTHVRLTVPAGLTNRRRI
ncbi:hypothetical protein FALBO_12593 [Fusarium albosuccineum]|uniref:Uncharacterized protein n=1 Tax=Fusarium albosuccineum TaxID=1237068 RepID=A0A8H4PH17_9HYPO|nr:hypothetical protein FALBO_12593 [Fusarium albosuccineum]